MPDAPAPTDPGSDSSPKSYFDLLKEKYSEGKDPEPRLVDLPRSRLDVGSKSLLAVTVLVLLATAFLTLTLRPTSLRWPPADRGPVATAPPRVAEVSTPLPETAGPPSVETAETSAARFSRIPEVAGSPPAPPPPPAGKIPPAERRPREEPPPQPARPPSTGAPPEIAGSAPGSAEAPRGIPEAVAVAARAEPHAPPGGAPVEATPTVPEGPRTSEPRPSPATPGPARAEEAAVARARPPAEAPVEPVEPPGRLVTPLPGYTQAAWVAGVQGHVLLRASIDERGAVTAVEVVQGLPHGLTEAAVAAVRRWRFRPATRGGEPVAVDHNLNIRFAL